MAVTKRFARFLNEGFADTKEFVNDEQILRIAIAAELDAINFYQSLVTKCESEDIKEVLLDIAYEEKVHVGELEEVLKSIDPDYEESKKEGSEEVN